MSSFLDKDGLQKYHNGIKELLKGKASSSHSHNFSDIKERGEAYLEWGGQNLKGTYGPIDAALVPELSANRFAFLPADMVNVEYTRDGGSTWATASVSDNDKVRLFSGILINSCVIGYDSSVNIDKTNYQIRITVTTSSSSETYIYTKLNKFILDVNTNGSTSCWCTISGRTSFNTNNNNDVWDTFANKVGVTGWNGFNVINTPEITTANSSDSGTKYRQLRFTFGTNNHPSTVAYSGLQILRIFGFGGVGWTAPSNMAKTGLIYTYDRRQNVTFPSKVSATIFYEDGSALEDKYAAKSHNHKPSEIQGEANPPSAEGTPYVLGSAGNGATGSWIDLNSYYALKGHTHNYLPLSGGAMSGKLQVNNVIFGYNFTNKRSSPAFVFDKAGTYLTGIGANDEADTIYFGAVNQTDYSWVDNYKQKWLFNGNVTANGDINGVTLKEDGVSLVDKYATKSHVDNVVGEFETMDCTLIEESDMSLRITFNKPVDPTHPIEIKNLNNGFIYYLVVTYNNNYRCGMITPDGYDTTDLIYQYYFGGVPTQDTGNNNDNELHLSPESSQSYFKAGHNVRVKYKISKYPFVYEM